MRIRLLLLLLSAILLGVRAAENPTNSFAEANKLYEQGRYPAAAAAYQKILREHGPTPPLYFNLGNALFKNGQVGRAIYYYRLAELLTPRDPDLRANLHFARDTVTGSVSALKRRDWLYLLTLNEWTCLGATLLWIWLILLFVREARPTLRRTLTGYTAAAGVAATIAAIVVGLALASRSSRREAIIITREAVVRLGPLEESQSAFTARDGVELPIVAESGEWLQVRDAANHLGWIPRRNALIFPPPG
jgi:tetratricopeptide (TPR) repeat protein